MLRPRNDKNWWPDTRSRNAKKWQPDTFGQEAIENLSRFVLVAERSAIQIRTFNSPVMKELWPKVQAEFYGDPLKYPVTMANPDDMEGRACFKTKCEEICFPLEAPQSPQE